MAEAGNLVIKVSADTTQFDRDIEKIERRTEKAQSKVDRQNEAARASIKSGASSLAGGAMAFGGAALRNPVLQRRFLPGRFGQVGKALSILSLAVPQLRVLGLIGAGFGLAKLAGRGQGSAGGKDPTISLMQQLLNEAKAQNLTLQEIQTSNMAARDPFRRGQAYATAMAQQRGNIMTGAQQLGGMAYIDAQNRLRDARSTHQNITRGLSSPIGAGYNNFKAAVLENANAFSSGMIAGRSASEGRNPTGAFAATLGAGVRDLFLGGSGSTALDVFGRMRAAMDPETSGPLGGRSFRQLAFLRHQGPGNILSAPETVRAGTTGEYQLRVRMQREEMQRQIQAEWNRKVLALLEKMANRGDVNPDEVWRFKLQTGRIEGVE